MVRTPIATCITIWQATVRGIVPTIKTSDWTSTARGLSIGSLVLPQKVWQSVICLRMTASWIGISILVSFVVCPPDLSELQHCDQLDTRQQFTTSHTTYPFPHIIVIMLRVYCITIWRNRGWGAACGICTIRNTYLSLASGHCTGCGGGCGSSGPLSAVEDQRPRNCSSCGPPILAKIRT